MGSSYNEKAITPSIVDKPDPNAPLTSQELLAMRPLYETNSAIQGLIDAALTRRLEMVKVK